MVILTWLIKSHIQYVMVIYKNGFLGDENINLVW